MGERLQAIHHRRELVKRERRLMVVNPTRAANPTVSDRSAADGFAAQRRSAASRCLPSRCASDASPAQCVIVVVGDVLTLHFPEMRQTSR
jgi:hypothetical protein